MPPERTARSARREEPASAARQLREAIAIPDYYPDDGPVYPGASPSVEKLHRRKVNLMFGTLDSVDAAVDKMGVELLENGWTLQPAMPAGNAVMLNGDKGARRVAVVVSVIEQGTPDEITMVAVSVDR